MTVDLSPAELRALVHALNMRITVFSERLQEVGGRDGASWRLVRGYIEADCALRGKLRSAIADHEEMERKLRIISKTAPVPERD